MPQRRHSDYRGELHPIYSAEEWSDKLDEARAKAKSLAPGLPPCSQLALTSERDRRRDQALATARLNGHEPYAYLKGVLERLPTQPASRIGELLPYRWAPAA